MIASIAGVVTCLSLCTAASADEDKYPEDEASKPVEIELSAAEDRFREALQNITNDFAQAIVKLLSAADRIEVCTLDFTDTLELSKIDDNLLITDYAPVLPYRYGVRILKRFDVPTKLFEGARDAIGKMIPKFINFGIGKGCHIPTHSVSLYRRDVLLFQTTISPHCKNFFFKSPIETDWVTIADDSVVQLLLMLAPLSEDIKMKIDERIRTEAHRPKSDGPR